MIEKDNNDREFLFQNIVLTIGSKWLINMLIDSLFSFYDLFLIDVSQPT